jgi:hypothetical protein
VKYYTAFIYADTEKTGLHCTHKYLGELTEEQKAFVEAMVTGYFSVHDVSKEVQPVCFCVEDWFGPKKDIRVLRPDSVDPDVWLLGLRLKLGALKKDDYPIFNPHISVPLGIVMIEKPFSHYALMSKGKVIRKWGFYD